MPKQGRLEFSQPGDNDKEIGPWPVRPNPGPIEGLKGNALFLKSGHQTKGRNGFV